MLGGVLFEENAERMTEICKSGMKITEDTKQMCLEYIDSKLAIEEVEVSWFCVGEQCTRDGAA